MRWVRAIGKPMQAKDIAQRFRDGSRGAASRFAAQPHSAPLPAADPPPWQGTVKNPCGGASFPARNPPPYRALSGDG